MFYARAIARTLLSKDVDNKQQHKTNYTTDNTPKDFGIFLTPTSVFEALIVFR